MYVFFAWHLHPFKRVLLTDTRTLPFPANMAFFLSITLYCSLHSVNCFTMADIINTNCRIPSSYSLTDYCFDWMVSLTVFSVCHVSQSYSQADHKEYYVWSRKVHQNISMEFCGRGRRFREPLWVIQLKLTTTIKTTTQRQTDKRKIISIISTFHNQNIFTLFFGALCWWTDCNGDWMWGHSRVFVWNWRERKT